MYETSEISFFSGAEDTNEFDVPAALSSKSSKKLPEKEGRYLVTLPLCGDDGNYDGYYVTVARWGTPPKEESTYFYLIFEENEYVYLNEVEAWMELPPPYEKKKK